MELTHSLRSGDRHVSTGRPMCHCLGVAEPEIRDAIEQEDLVTVRGVTQACGAGGGCTACHRHLKRLLNEHAVSKRMSPAPVSCPSE